MTIDRFAIRTRMRDSSLVAALPADAPTVRVTFEYLAWATVWPLVGTTIGLIASIKRHWPEFLPFAWLSFGRVRPAHTNLVLFGWSSLVLVGLSLRRIPYLARPTVEPTPRQDRALALEPGSPRRSRDTITDPRQSHRTYSATPAGMDRANGLRNELSGDVVGYLDEVVRWVRSLRFDELVRAIIVTTLK